jgi:hypothetical protein
MRSRSVCRSMADGLAQLTSRISRPGRRDWAHAMAAEQRYIDDNVEALRWAAGCLYASLLTQLRDGALLNHRLVRWAIASWAAYQAENNLCTALLLISYKLHIHGLAALLARWCPGDDFRSLYPVFDAVSSWEVGLGLVATALYALAAVLLLRRRFYGAHTFIVALGICGGLWLYELSKPTYFDAFPLSDHLHDALLYGLEALLAWVVWTGVPRGPTRSHAQ